jgi:hypothetical protein
VPACEGLRALEAHCEIVTPYTSPTRIGTFSKYGAHS